VIYVDNCPVRTNIASAHWLEEHGMPRIPHQACSPDLALSDFYLFPTVKQKLESFQMIDNDELFDCLQELLAGIDQEELNLVFQAWVQQVHEVSQDNGGYVR
jgi:hypothetical protein